LIREADLAYVAGIVDADGCIRVEKLKNNGRSRDGTSYAAFIAVQQVEPQAVELAKAIFGGYLITVKPTPKMPNARTMLRWTAKSQVAARALVLLCPYLRIKRPQAENAIALASLVVELNRARYVGVVPGRNGPRQRTPAELDRLAIYFETSRRLNSGHLTPAYEALQERRTAQQGLTL
jgi:hypothetical protein